MIDGRDDGRGDGDEKERDMSSNDSDGRDIYISSRSLAADMSLV